MLADDEAHGIAQAACGAQPRVAHPGPGTLGNGNADAHGFPDLRVLLLLRIVAPAIVVGQQTQILLRETGLAQQAPDGGQQLIGLEPLGVARLAQFRLHVAQFVAHVAGSHGGQRIVVLEDLRAEAVSGKNHTRWRVESLATQQRLEGGALPAPCWIDVTDARRALRLHVVRAGPGQQ